MFVGSSWEAKGLIRGLSLNLKDEEVDIRNWGTSRWSLSQGTLDGIEQKLDEADFAAFILSADDIAIIRGEQVEVARDNVLFELGLSFGRLGREHTFILAPKGSLHTPTDLAGITVVQYQSSDPDKRKSMDNPASELLEAIQARGRRERPGPVGALARGDTTRIDTVADAALHVFDSRNTYVGELRQAVLKGEKVPPKFQFAAADGGRHWLTLCLTKNYKYFNRAKTHLRNNVTRLADAVHNAAGTPAIDLVSLGCGNGTKDEIILQALTERLKGQDYVYYYPIDISDILLVEAVRYVSQHGPDRSRLRCKAVLGDFTHLSAFRPIIGYRRTTKLFSALGNVLGSFDESEILKSISGAMEPGDLVLLEANIGEPEDSLAMLEDDAANQWDLSTLDALDIDRDSLEFGQEMSEHESIVPGTRTLVSYAVPCEDQAKRYMLSALHHYNFEELKACTERELRVKLIDEIPGEGVCLLLGQRSG
jgi:uncharacterized SAM-dependent methyltransferase